VKKKCDTVLTLAVVAFVLFLAISNLELALILAAAALLYAVIRRMCGPMVDPT
jgi:hypothetical protein